MGGQNVGKKKISSFGNPAEIKYESCHISFCLGHKLVLLMQPHFLDIQIEIMSFNPENFKILIHFQLTCPRLQVNIVLLVLGQVYVIFRLVLCTSHSQKNVCTIIIAMNI